MFLPDGPARPLRVGKPFVRVLRGTLSSYVEVWLSQVKHRISLLEVPGEEGESVDVRNWVDIRQENNFELVMRLESEIESGQDFFTDLNGFQVRERPGLA